MSKIKNIPKKAKILIVIILSLLIVLSAVLLIVHMRNGNKNENGNEKLERENIALDIQSEQVVNVEEEIKDTSTLLHPNQKTKYYTYWVEDYIKVYGEIYGAPKGPITLPNHLQIEAGKVKANGDKAYFIELTSQLEVPSLGTLEPLSVEVPWFLYWYDNEEHYNQVSHNNWYFSSSNGEYLLFGQGKYKLVTKYCFKQELILEEDSNSVSEYGPMELVSAEVVSCEEYRQLMDIVPWKALVETEQGLYFFENGEINYDYNGIVYNGDNHYYVENGKVNFDYTGLSFSSTEFYVESAYVDISSEDDMNYDSQYLDYIPPEAIWYIKNGKVNFGYTGPITWEGNTYEVVNGIVQ